MHTREGGFGGGEDNHWSAQNAALVADLLWKDFVLGKLDVCVSQMSTFPSLFSCKIWFDSVLTLGKGVILICSIAV